MTAMVDAATKIGASGTRLFAQLMETLPVAAAVLDRQLRYVVHNARWLTIHALDGARDWAGVAHHEAFAKVPPGWESACARCLAGDRDGVEIDSCDDVTAPGVCIRWRLAAARDDSGAVVGLIVYAENVAERERARQQLAERENLIRDLFDQSPVGMNLCTLEGLWLESNQAFCDILGYTRDEADGSLTYWQLTPRKYDADEAVQLEKLRTTRRYGPYEKEFVRKDGSLVPVRLNGFLVEREGQPYIWSLIEDLTAQRALEQRLESERLNAIQAAKLAAVGELAAGIAHEINNPLTIIDAYAFALGDAVTRQDWPGAHEAAGAIRDAVSRAGKIVHGLRRFTRHSTSDAVGDVEVRTIIDEAVTLCNARVRDHRAQLEVDVATSASVRGHPIELEQVLVNLLNNATDAVGGAAERWIRVRAEEQGEGRVRIVVEDSGRGVAPELREQVFRPFFTTKPIGAGTGLGLSISRSIVERFGGTLTLDEAAPHTRFVLDLPRSAG